MNTPATVFASILMLMVFVSAQDAAPVQPVPNQEQKDKPVGQDPNTTFKVDVKLVNVFATVTDQYGAPVTDLKKEEFQVAEDDIPQQVALFEQHSEIPLSIVIAIDSSQSVGKDLKLEVDAARKFAASILRPEDQISLYQFSDVVRELVPFTSNLSRINRGLQTIRLGSGTALYDTIYLSGQTLINRQGRKVIVVVTDGGDTVSKVDYHSALRAAQQSEAIVYSIIDVPITASAGRNTGGEHALIQMSKDTGGKHYYADSPAGIERVFQKISRELRTQYLLGYYPNRRLSDSDFRRIEVKIARKEAPQTTQAETQGADNGSEASAGVAASGYLVRHRSGYYTSKLE